MTSDRLGHHPPGDAGTAAAATEPSAPDTSGRIDRNATVSARGRRAALRPTRGPASRRPGMLRGVPPALVLNAVTVVTGDEEFLVAREVSRVVALVRAEEP